MTSVTRIFLSSLDIYYLRRCRVEEEDCHPRVRVDNVCGIVETGSPFFLCRVSIKNSNKPSRCIFRLPLTTRSSHLSSPLQLPPYSHPLSTKHQPPHVEHLDTTAPRSHFVRKLFQLYRHIISHNHSAILIIIQTSLLTKSMSLLQKPSGGTHPS